MNVKLIFSIEIDEKDYHNLKKSEIREIVKQAEVNGSIFDYIKSEVKGSLEDENFNKSRN